jgi:hypothetical protein
VGFFFFARQELAMCFRDLVKVLRARGVEATESQLRWAIKTGKVSRPPLDGSLRFRFTGSNVEELLAHFGGRGATGAGATA